METLTEPQSSPTPYIRRGSRALIAAYIIIEFPSIYYTEAIVVDTRFRTGITACCKRGVRDTNCPASCSTEEERALGAPGLPLVAESGLSGSEVLKLGGASREKPGISEGFHGLDFTVGELARGGGFLAVAVGPGLVTGGGDLTGGADVFDIAERVVGLRVGVGALDVGLDDAGKVGLEVGVEDLGVVLDKGVVDLGGAAGLLEVNVGLEVGVEDLEGLGAEVDVGLEAVVDVDLGAAFSVGLADEDNVGRPVGVAGLDPGPPEDEGLRIPALELFNPGDGADCLDDKLLREAGSGWGQKTFNVSKPLEGFSKLDALSRNHMLLKLSTYHLL
ncbi:hypothetical protein C3L33_02877, partial [Rhododendron williamsianum]